MKLEADKLNVWVFGPGVGEFVVVHVPPTGWLSIDGCSANAAGWPVAFFENQGVAPTHILMTHPHADHARGVQQLVERFTAGPQPWPRLGLVTPSRRLGPRGASQASYDTRLATGVLSAVQTRWKRNPATKWQPRAGGTEVLGSGRLRVLSPDSRALQAARGPNFDWNRVASALAIEWQGHRLVLGADLVEVPGGGWSAVLRAAPEAREHVLLKVAHHGSLAAQHVPLLARLRAEKKVTLVTTPFASQDLPRFQRGEGAELLLMHGDKLLLTGLPQRFDTQNKKPRQWPRARLAKLKKPIAADEPMTGFPSNYLHFVLDASGKLKTHWGPGSVIVHP